MCLPLDVNGIPDPTKKQKSAYEKFKDYDEWMDELIDRVDGMFRNGELSPRQYNHVHGLLTNFKVQNQIQYEKATRRPENPFNRMMRE